MPITKRKNGFFFKAVFAKFLMLSVCLRDSIFAIPFLFIIFFFTEVVGEETIKLGTSTHIMSQIAGSIVQGREVTAGINLYLQKVNAAGGILGTKMELIVLDDHHEPRRATQNIRQLIYKDDVLLIIGNNGTPSITISIPIINKGQTLLYNATPESPIVHPEPPNRYIITMRAGAKEVLKENVTHKKLENNNTKNTPHTHFTLPLTGQKTRLSSSGEKICSNASLRKSSDLTPSPRKILGLFSSSSSIFSLSFKSFIF